MKQANANGQPQQQQPQSSIDDSLSTFGPGSIVGQKYKLEEKIGQGSFGMIWKCTNTDTQEVIAIKLEKRNQKHSSMLVREIKVMMEMKNEKGFARMFSYGKDENYNYVVMTYLGRNLDSLLKKCGGKFSLSTICNIADQMISRLEALHNKNLIHRDIKPENYVIGYGNNYQIINIIDFGLAKYYKDSDGNHIQFVEKKGMIGTARYASLNAHNGYEQSRRDDLEALGYVLLYFIKGRLPWQNIYAETKEEKYEKIKQMKQQQTLEQLCENAPIELIQYFRHVRGLNFQECPNYQMLKKLFKKILVDKKIESQSQTLDWESLPDYRQRKKFQTISVVHVNNQQPSAIEKQPVNIQDKINEKKEKSLKHIDSQKKIKSQQDANKDQQNQNSQHELNSPQLDKQAIQHSPKHQKQSQHQQQHMQQQQQSQQLQPQKGKSVNLQQQILSSQIQPIQNQPLNQMVQQHHLASPASLNQMVSASSLSVQLNTNTSYSSNQQNNLVSKIPPEIKANSMLNVQLTTNNSNLNFLNVPLKQSESKEGSQQICQIQTSNQQSGSISLHNSLGTSKLNNYDFSESEGILNEEPLLNQFSKILAIESNQACGMQLMKEIQTKNKLSDQFHQGSLISNRQDFILQGKPSSLKNLSQLQHEEKKEDSKSADQKKSEQPHTFTSSQTNMNTQLKRFTFNSEISVTDNQIEQEECIGSQINVLQVKIGYKNQTKINLQQLLLLQQNIYLYIFTNKKISCQSWLKSKKIFI